MYIYIFMYLCIYVCIHRSTYIHDIRMIIQVPHRASRRSAPWRVYICVHNIPVYMYVCILCIPVSTCQCLRVHTAHTCWSWSRHCRTSRACPFPAWTGAGSPSGRRHCTRASHRRCRFDHRTSVAMQCAYLRILILHVRRAPAGPRQDSCA